MAAGGAEPPRKAEGSGGREPPRKSILRPVLVQQLVVVLPELGPRRGSGLGAGGQGPRAPGPARKHSMWRGAGNYFITAVSPSGHRHR